jgi:hypothetical protein
MKKIGYLITLLSILSVFTFSANAGQAIKKPPAVIDQGNEWNNSFLR